MKLKKLLSVEGETEVQIIINNKNKKAYYSLQTNRKFDLKSFKSFKI